MIYKFKSKAAGDVIMMGLSGDQVLRLAGREPAAKGIIEAAAMPAVIEALEAAVREEGAARASDADDQPPSRREGAVALRQRVWPLVELLKRSAAAGEDVVWGA